MERQNAAAGNRHSNAGAIVPSDKKSNQAMAPIKIGQGSKQASTKRRIAKSGNEEAAH
jgi:hypothetical protein